MYVDCTIAESDAAILKAGDEPEVLIEALARKFHGKIIYVSPSMDTDSKTYYLNPNGGNAVVGVQAIDGVKYLFDINGVRCSGITEFNGALYYCDPVTGALLCNGSFNLEGADFITNEDGIIIPVIATAG